MSTTRTFNGSPQALPTPRHRWLAARLRRAVAAIRHEMRLRRDIAHLQALDDRMLADIGLGAGEVENAVRSGRRPASQRLVTNPPNARGSELPRIAAGKLFHRRP